MHIFAILYPKTTIIIWCYQLATSNLKVINSLNDIQIGVVNWLYKWLESLKLSLALQLAKFRN